VLYKTVRIRIYQATILSVILYGSETWYLTRKEEHRLKMSENKVLRRNILIGEELGDRKLEETE
jgi:hypothetical protein